MYLCIWVRHQIGQLLLEPMNESDTNLRFAVRTGGCQLSLHAINTLHLRSGGSNGEQEHDPRLPNTPSTVYVAVNTVQ